MVPNTRNILPFEYLVSSGAMAASAAAQVTLTLQADSNFELQALMGSSSLDADTDFMPNNFSCQITDQSTGRQLMSARIPQRILVGPSNGSLMERHRIVFPAQAILLFDFLNLDSGNANTVTFVLKGYKHLIG